MVSGGLKKTIMRYDVQLDDTIANGKSAYRVPFPESHPYGAMVDKNHVVADQKDIDDLLMAQPRGKESLDAAMDAALSMAADRKFHELLAMPDANLLMLKASLPNLQLRATRIQVQASKDGLDIVDSLQVRAQKIAAGTGYSIGDAFSFSGRLR